MKLSIIQVPYDSGQLACRMGRGPLHLVEHGLLGELTAAGHEVELVEIRLPEAFRTVVGAAMSIVKRVGLAVRMARQNQRFPLVLSGNCNYAALGTVAALGGEATGVVWLDAHGDFNTPDTSPSGFFDGMALSVLTGNCWRGPVGSLERFRPVPEANVVLVGARELDPPERELLDASAVERVSVDRIRREPMAVALGGPIGELARRVEQIYLHVDLDVIDGSEARVNTFAAEGGLTVAELLEAIRAIGSAGPVAAAALTAYDPEADEDQRGRRVAESALLAILRAAAGP